MHRKHVNPDGTEWADWTMDAASYRLWTLQLPDGRPLVERPPKWFRDEMRKARKASASNVPSPPRNEGKESPGISGAPTR